jgi:hypothetical protein
MYTGVAEEQHPEDDPILGIIGLAGIGQDGATDVKEWEDEAERLLVQYHDQRFSYVDATSCVTMRRLGIQEALAFDTDFVITGFTLVGDE